MPAKKKRNPHTGGSGSTKPPVGGPLDSFIDKKVEKQLRLRLSPERFALMFENLLANDNPLIDLIEPFVAPHVDDMSAVCSEAILTLLLGEQHEGFGASGEPEVRRLMRNRIHRHAAAELMKERPELSRREARERVREEITDERIIEASQKVAAEQGMQAPVGGDWWEWLKSNWFSILMKLLPLLLLFLGPKPETENT